MSAHVRWKRGDFFLLGDVQYLPESRKVRIWFENHDVGEASVQVLWGGRPGQADWSKVSVDPESRGALLVPTVPGQPTSEGDTAEIPSDLVRAATDVDYRAYITKRAASWAKRIGGELTQVRQKCGFSQASLAQAAGIEEPMISAIENGRIEVPMATLGQLFEAMHANLPSWLSAGHTPTGTDDRK